MSKQTDDILGDIPGMKKKEDNNNTNTNSNNNINNDVNNNTNNNDNNSVNNNINTNDNVNNNVNNDDIVITKKKKAPNDRKLKGVYLDEKQRKIIDRLKEQTGRNESEIVRIALNYLWDNVSVK